jgi:hypothetical protein
MTEFLRKINKTDIRNIIAVIGVIGSFVLLYFMIIKPIPAENKDTLNLSIGFVFGGLISGIAGYYFGSSKGETKAKENE